MTEMIVSCVRLLGMMVRLVSYQIEYLLRFLTGKVKYQKNLQIFLDLNKFAFAITVIDDVAIAISAITGFKIPAIAKGIAITL